MKRRTYSVINEEFSLFLNELDKELKATEMGYSLVGGAAVQTHLANLLSRKYEKSIGELDDKVRLQNYIRATDDVDLCLPITNDAEGAKKILALIKSLEKELISPTEQHFIKYTLERSGIRRPVFRVYVDGETVQDSLIKLNLYTSAKDVRGFDAGKYSRFVDNSQEISFPYCNNFDVKARVASKEDTLAGKISRFSPKDAMDIWNLTLLTEELGEKLDTREMKNMLLPNHEEHYNLFMHGLKVSQGKEEPINHPDLIN